LTVSSFFGDVAFAKSDGKWSIIDRKGKYLLKLQFAFIKTDMDEVLSVNTDFYETAGFVNSFFKKANNNSFDGFYAASTLQSIVDNYVYGDYVKAEDKYIACCNNVQKIADDVMIVKTLFHFTSPIYESVRTYSWGYGTDTERRYRFAEKITDIEYRFNLLGDARDKGKIIADVLKAEIEKRYDVKMKSENGRYLAYRDNGFSFAIIYNEFRLSLHVGFKKEKLQNLLSDTEYENYY
jgi:hypothetical protein